MIADASCVVWLEYCIVWQLFLCVTELGYLTELGHHMVHVTFCVGLIIRPVNNVYNPLFHARDIALPLSKLGSLLQYIPRNMHMVLALLCFVVVIHWLIFPYPSGLLHWPHCGNLTIAPVPAKQPWWIWNNTSCKFIMNDCITTTKQSITKPCAYFLWYTVYPTVTCLKRVS